MSIPNTVLNLNLKDHPQQKMEFLENLDQSEKSLQKNKILE